MPRRQEIPISSLMVEVDLLSAWHLNYLKLPPSRSASQSCQVFFLFFYSFSFFFSSREVAAAPSSISQSESSAANSRR